ncbi:hypothetical protein B2J88_43325 [Rhodococcus sp. SRB_17]|nr:hypothetical protein [Rhodococcus sp. SRB_17]
MTDQPAGVNEETIGITDAYHDENGDPIMAESVVIYIDALATKVYWEQESDVTKLTFVRDWVRQFDEFREELEQYRSAGSPIAVTFTDNVAVAIPLESHQVEMIGLLAEGGIKPGLDAAHLAHDSLDQLMSMLFSLQIHVLRLVTNHGRLFRGAVRVGPAFADKWTIIGDGLIDAVVGEEHQTIVPAIQLPEWMVQAYELDALFYNDRKLSTFHQMLAHTTFTWQKDSNSEKESYSFVFLNYLACPDAADFDLWRDEAIPAHAALVTEGLRTNTNGGVLFKFQWAASYHNWVVTENGLDASLFVTQEAPATHDIVVQSLDKIG